MKINITSPAGGLALILVQDAHDIVLFDGSLQCTQDGYELNETQNGYWTVIKTFRGNDDLRRMSAVMTFLSAYLKKAQEPKP